jgi:hypothetical protein
LEMLKYLANSSGYSVISVANRGESLFEELQRALVGSSKTVFLSIITLNGSIFCQSLAPTSPKNLL